ncbi:MAG: methionyl-tRNA formyltransferase [bacterium]|nr:methionyl-tRNA formyltransferase [bacterium]
MRLLFFGTPEFAVPTLARLLAGNHPVVGVVSQPDRRRGRGRKTTPSPVAAHAMSAGVPLFRPEKVGAQTVADELAATEPDLGVVVAFGQFLPKRIRELPSRGYLINGHASLLPRHRGAAPIAHALLAGDAETGVSVMRVEREMDAGPVALEKRTKIGPDEDCGSLTRRIAELTAEAIDEGLAEIANDRVKWVEQDPSAATFASKIERRDAHLDWSEDASALARRVRAMGPRPGAFSEWNGEPLRILAARAEAGPVGEAPGTVVVIDEQPRIATGEGWLYPLELQRPGGKAMAVSDFQRGRGLQTGTQLGSEACE